MMFPYVRMYNLAHPSSAGGVDNIPDAVDWPDIIWDETILTGDVSSKQITGITSGIYIQIQPGTGTGVTLYYQIGSTNLTGSHNGNPPTSPWASVTSNTTVIVSGNQWLSFVCHGAGFNNRTATIVNTSNSNQTLDTFSYSIAAT